MRGWRGRGAACGAGRWAGSPASRTARTGAGPCSTCCATGLGALSVPVPGGVDVGHGDTPLSLALGPAGHLGVAADALTTEPAPR
ncbi:hypothetical protein [Actinosynnema pretiosum]|uniref:hypothetical protein n=1 Tax=Actinosynnema pretiosum TaxID=42197 RepID=UPI0012FE55D9|nr:hypothetical protein [Actinosynnema pretiosum]